MSSTISKPEKCCKDPWPSPSHSISRCSVLDTKNAADITAADSQNGFSSYHYDQDTCLSSRVENSYVRGAKTVLLQPVSPIVSPKRHFGNKTKNTSPTMVARSKLVPIAPKSLSPQQKNQPASEDNVIGLKLASTVFHKILPKPPVSEYMVRHKPPTPPFTGSSALSSSSTTKTSTSSSDIAGGARKRLRPIAPKPFALIASPPRLSTNSSSTQTITNPSHSVGKNPTGQSAFSPSYKPIAPKTIPSFAPTLLAPPKPKISKPSARKQQLYHPKSVPLITKPKLSYPTANIPKTRPAAVAVHPNALQPPTELLKRSFVKIRPRISSQPLAAQTDDPQGPSKHAAKPLPKVLTKPLPQLYEPLRKIATRTPVVPKP